MKKSFAVFCIPFGNLRSVAVLRSLSELPYHPEVNLCWTFAGIFDAGDPAYGCGYMLIISQFPITCSLLGRGHAWWPIAIMCVFNGFLLLI